MGTGRGRASGSTSADGVADPFRSLAETTPDAIVSADASDEIVYVNPAAEALLGYAAVHLVGQPVTTIVPDSQRSVHHDAFSRYVATGEANLVGRTVVVDVRRRDGSTVPVELSLGASGSGAGVVVTAVIRDISERVRFHRNVSAQLAVTSALAGGGRPDGEAGVIHALTEALGWQVGAMWLVAEDDRLLLTELWEADPDATKAFSDVCRTVRFARGEGIPGLVWESGEPRWLMQDRQQPRFVRTEAAAASGLRSGVSLPLVSEGEVRGILEVFTSSELPLDEDLRAMLGTVASQVAESLRRQQHADELARSNHDLDHFAHMVAHDLAEPLSTIAGFSELLRSREAQNLSEPGRAFVDAIAAGAGRGRHMLSSVLALAQYGTAALHVTQVDCRELVEEVVTSLQASVAEHGATIEVAELPVVDADRTLLGQVFQNLLANAMKFRGETRPEIRVSGEANDGHWRFVVSDNGQGIPAGFDVFGMFVRPAGQTKPGMGLGLAICEKIVKRHGGSIGYESEPGSGTTFSFTIRRPPGR